MEEPAWDKTRSALAEGPEQKMPLVLVTSRGGRARGGGAVVGMATSLWECPPLLCVCTFVLVTCTGLRPFPALQVPLQRGLSGSVGCLSLESVLVGVPKAVHGGQAAGATCRAWGWLLGRGDLGAWRIGGWAEQTGCEVPVGGSGLWLALGLCSVLPGSAGGTTVHNVCTVALTEHLLCARRTVSCPLAPSLGPDPGCECVGELHPCAGMLDECV